MAAVCISHSPLRGRTDPQPDVEQVIASARQFVRSFSPDLVVCVAPDHLNGFLYRGMPQICVGTAAEAIGDFGSPVGLLDVAAETATSCAIALLESGVDAAVSNGMRVDHAFSQPLEMLGVAVPVVPVFVNAAAPPRAPLHRSRVYGRVLGEWAIARGERVLFIGSGGLAHDPPTPAWDGAGPDLRERLLDGIAPDVRAGREATVDELARRFARGESDLRPLAPELDAAFLELVHERRLHEVHDWDDGWLTKAGGRGVHEIRTWVTALSALETAGEYRVTSSFHRSVPEWLVGFGVVTAEVS